MILQFLKFIRSIHWIQRFDNSAKIEIVARPRGDDWFEDEINQFEE